MHKWIANGIFRGHLRIIIIHAESRVTFYRPDCLTESRGDSFLINIDNILFFDFLAYNIVCFFAAGGSKDYQCGCESKLVSRIPLITRTQEIEIMGEKLFRIFNCLLGSKNRKQPFGNEACSGITL